MLSKKKNHLHPSEDCLSFLIFTISLRVACTERERGSLHPVYASPLPISLCSLAVKKVFESPVFHTYLQRSNPTPPLKTSGAPILAKTGDWIIELGRYFLSKIGKKYDF